MLKELKQIAEYAGKCDGRRYHLGAYADGVYSRNVCNAVKALSHHAEIRLLRRARNPTRVLVARRRRDGSLGLAKPCPHCQAALLAAGVRTIIYSINDEQYGVLRVSGGAWYSVS